MIFGLLVTGILGYGAYKGTKGMIRRAFAKESNWAWALSLPVLILVFVVTYWYW
jgi:phosphate/sulfate permease